MAQLFQSKFKPDPNSAKTFVLNKSLQQSYAEYEFPIRILSCSETDMYFICDLDLKEGMLIRVTVPVPMYITVAKHPKNAKITTGFYGLINGLGEDVRMNLRKFVNSVFFRSLEEQKAAEKAEVERLKKEAMAKKAEEEKSRREAQERAKAAADKLKLESKQKEQDELEKKLDQAIKDDTDQAES